MCLHFGVRGIATMLLLAFLPFTGCSWLFVTKPPEPPHPAFPPLECTSSVASPMIDTVAAGLLAGLGVATVVAARPGGRWHPVHGLLRPLQRNLHGVHGRRCRADRRRRAAGVLGRSWVRDHLGLSTSEGDPARVPERRRDSCAVLRGSPSRQGKAAGEPCAEGVECREGNTCFQGRCRE